MTGLPDPIRHSGNQALFRALDLSILSTFVGLPLHVHVEGLRGTGKTTIIRSVRHRLPRIQRIRGCVFNCVPWAPHCPQHRGMTQDEVRAIGTEWIRMPFREISHSAKVGTVAGSIDLARIADARHPEAALLPGSLPQAHRGIVFVDEVNRLADTAPELADILLDVMGTKPGRLQIEETGLPSVDLPLCVSVWAASNPDEDPGPLGDIRKQLSDRFDFVIVMERPSAVATVQDILRSSQARHLALAAAGGAPAADGLLGVGSVPAGPEPGSPDQAEGSPEAVRPSPEASPDSPELARGLAEDTAPDLVRWALLSEAVRLVECPPPVEELVASLYVDFGLESLRGVEAIHHGARLNSVLEGRDRVTLADVISVAPGALQHRLDVSTFARVMDHLAQRARTTGDPAPDDAAPAGGGEAAAGPGGASRSLGPGLDRAAALAAAPQANDGAPGGAEAPGPGAGGIAPGQGSDQDAKGRTQSGGWQSFWSLLGRRRPSGSGDGPGSPSRGTASGEAGSSRAPASGHASGCPSQPSPGGAARPDSTGASGAPAERPVAPPHPARPLSEILREMELGGPGPQGPLVP